MDLIIIFFFVKLKPLFDHFSKKKKKKSTRNLILSEPNMPNFSISSTPRLQVGFVYYSSHTLSLSLSVSTLRDINPIHCLNQKRKWGTTKVCDFVFWDGGMGCFIRIGISELAYVRWETSLGGDDPYGSSTWNLELSSKPAKIIAGECQKAENIRSRIFFLFLSSVGRKMRCCSRPHHYFWVSINFFFLLFWFSLSLWCLHQHPRFLSLYRQKYSITFPLLSIFTAVSSNLLGL